MKKQDFLNRSTIVPIDDFHGPSISSISYDAIVVSTETEKVAQEINKLREKRGVPPLAIIVVPMVPTEDLERISSTRIRNGEIDHNGRLILPQKLRSTLARPIGILKQVQDDKKTHGRIVISVGDTTTEVLLSQSIVPTLAIIDFQARRERFDWKIDLWDMLLDKRKISYFTSGPGFIDNKVMNTIRLWSKNPKKFLFVIDGEEDLLVLPAILFAPIGSIVYYGQPEKGIIQVIVTAEQKQNARKLLLQFI